VRLLTALVDLYQHLRRRNHRHAAPRGVVLISSGGLGDTVLLATVFERFAKLAIEGEHVTLILRQDAAPMAFLFDGIAMVETIDYSRLDRQATYRHRTLSNLHNQNFRLAISLDFLRHPHLDEALIAACAAQTTHAMKPRPWAKHVTALARNRRLYTDQFDSGPAHLDKVIRWQHYADWLLKSKNPLTPLRLPARCLPEPATLDRPTVFVQPFSAVSSKQVSPDFLAHVLEAVPSDWKICLTGAPTDMERSPAYATLLDAPRITFDCRSFKDLLPELRAAAAVLSVDTAMLHLAAAAGVPTLGLASAAYVGEIVPYDAAIAPANVHIIYNTMPCEGCLGICHLPLEDGIFPCVARLDAHVTKSAFEAILQN
jgi:ADP-heptose:LPS heptosyltransferase